MVFLINSLTCPFNCAEYIRVNNQTPIFNTNVVSCSFNIHFNTRYTNFYILEYQQQERKKMIIKFKHNWKIGVSQARLSAQDRDRTYSCARCNWHSTHRVDLLTISSNYLSFIIMTCVYLSLLITFWTLDKEDTTELRPFIKARTKLSVTCITSCKRFWLYYFLL